MGKKRGRERIVNSQPFLAERNAFMIANNMRDKILKEAFKQQKDIFDEQIEEISAFSVAIEAEEHDEEEDIDEFAGFADTQSLFDDYEDQINEDDERLLEAFLSKDAGPQRTLGDVIAARIKEQDTTVSSGRPMPKLDNSVIEHYKTCVSYFIVMVGKLLSTYTKGRLPKGFKHIPAYMFWQEMLYLTEPEKWSPCAVYQATRLFASNMNGKKAESFYKFVLLPRIREDIRKHKILHTALYQTLKKALYKPAAFNKGILFPIFESGNCSLREAVIIGSVLQKMSIPLAHS
ncbi:Bystin, partial [Bienertia sinuspersici]